jgi:Lon protease-like protein
MTQDTNRPRTGTPFVTKPEDLPQTLPIFPLAGVMLLPSGRLPLNIFEPRYVAMVEEALGNKRLIGMVQPTGHTDPDGKVQIFQVGCAGRIHSFNETEDGRFLINLQGICRFRIAEELELQRGFRRVRPLWDEYLPDLTMPKPATIDRENLQKHMKCYFKLQGVAGDWDTIEKTDDCRLITSLAMICPFTPSEKQALLEAKDTEERCRLLVTLMDMALLGDDEETESVKH